MQNHMNGLQMLAPSSSEREKWCSLFSFEGFDVVHLSIPRLTAGTLFTTICHCFCPLCNVWFVCLVVSFSPHLFISSLSWAFSLSLTDASFSVSQRLRKITRLSSTRRDLKVKYTWNAVLSLFSVHLIMPHTFSWNIMGSISLYL